MIERPVGNRLRVDGAVWPRPSLESDEIYGVGHIATYGTPTKEDLLELAAIAHAYGELVTNPKAAKLLPNLRKLLREELEQDAKAAVDASS